MELKLNNLLNCNPWLTDDITKPKKHFQDVYQVVKYCIKRVKSQVLIEECSPSGNQDTNHNPRDMEMSNLSTCPSYTLCYLSLDLSIS